jgi:type IV pilus assembly protein PilV
MVTMNHRAPRSQRGTSLVEVLVTMVILAIGLLALAGLQARLHVLQIESYQRAQALILLGDMAGRITNNRYDVVDYVTATPLGTGAACPTTTATREEADATEWCNQILGASETDTGGDAVGAMVGGRGCVEALGGDEYLVTVAWQGLIPISAPPATVTCGENEYNGDAGSQCLNDLCRRVVTTVIRIPTLT